jgi:hypothetical protein
MRDIQNYFNEECYYHKNASEWVLHYYINNECITFVSYEKMGVKVAFDAFINNLTNGGN